LPQPPILAIDLGSTKVVALIAQQENEELVVTGLGIAPSHGVKKGTITNIDLASRAIKEAYEDAKRMAGSAPTRAIVSISGTYIKSTHGKGVVTLPNKEISVEEINRALQAAFHDAENIPHEYEVIHILPYRFKVDDQDCIEDPLGMTASRLEVYAHIVYASKSGLFNLKKAFKQAGIDIENVVMCGYASAIAVLDEDEKKRGACVIDMGGNTCNLIIHLDNSIVYNDFLGVGSGHITNDLSVALLTPLSAAEQIKIYYGDLTEPQNDYIEIPVIGDENSTTQISLEIVYNVIHARVEETLMILAKSIEKSKLKERIGAGVILTGGMTKLKGLRELALAIFDHIPIRLAKPRPLLGMENELRDPIFSTVVGLVLYGAGEFTPYEIDSNKRLRFKNEHLFAKEEKIAEPLTEPLAEPALQARTLPPPAAAKKPKKDIPDETVIFPDPYDKPGRKIEKFIQWLTQLF